MTRRLRKLWTQPVNRRLLWLTMFAYIILC